MYVTDKRKFIKDFVCAEADSVDGVICNFKRKIFNNLTNFQPKLIISIKSHKTHRVWEFC